MKVTVDVRNKLNGCGTWIEIEEADLKQLREHLSFIKIEVGEPYLTVEKERVCNGRTASG